MGAKVYLRPVTSDDISSIHLWGIQSEPQSMSCRPRLLLSAAEAVEAYKGRTTTDSNQRFTICNKRDKTPVGMTNYFDLNNLNRSAELGLLIDHDMRKKGFGSEALMILIDYLFDYRGLYKVHAQTAEFNKGTIALLESLGFHRDGVLRSHYFYDANFHDGYIYSLLLADRDWT